MDFSPSVTMFTAPNSLHQLEIWLALFAFRTTQRGAAFNKRQQPLTSA
jgi:hypothetical protein